MTPKSAHSIIHVQCFNYIMRDVSPYLLTTAKDGELIQMGHFCHDEDNISHPNSSYITTKPYGTPTRGCNIFQKELFSGFLPSTYAGKVG